LILAGYVGGKGDGATTLGDNIGDDASGLLFPGAEVDCDRVPALSR